MKTARCNFAHRCLLLPILCGLWLAAGVVAEASNWRSTLYPENWTPPAETVPFASAKLIQDFSYAGYRRGEEPIPNVTGPVFDVTSYGADASGTSDSTVAIQNAINAAAAAGGGVVFLPAGTFRVSPQGTNTFALRISTSNIVLRGAGSASTLLLNTSTTMNGKAVIQISPSSTPLGTIRNITADLAGPTRRIPVDNASSFAPGQIVRIEWEFTNDWIAEHNQQTWWNDTNGRPANARYLREVTATHPAQGWIEVDVPTRYTIKTRDIATVRTISGLLSNVGIESLGIGNLQHPGTGWGEGDYTDPTKAAYDTHNSWLVRTSNVRDSWISSVHSRQATGNTTTCHMLSNGISLANCMRVTVQNCQMRRPQYGGGGGNGYMYRLQSSNDCLVRNNIADFCRHGFVVSHAGTSGNVFHQCEDRETQRATGSSGSYTTSGSGSDNHMHFSHSNLWDQCHAHNSFYTAHHRLFNGTTPHGATSAHGIYWNTTGSGTRYASSSNAIVRSEQLRFGYIIGTRPTSGTAYFASTPTGGNTSPADHLEGVNLGGTLSPQSLYLDQVSRRLSPAVIYLANGATSGTAPVDPASPYAPGATVTVLGPGSLSRTGFVFTGWNTAPDRSGTSHAPGSTFQITGTRYLYADWMNEPVVVTYASNGGSAADPVSKTVEVNAPYGPLAVTTRTDFSFVGWFTALTGGTMVTPTTTVTSTSDHTLHARWNARPVVNAGSNQVISLTQLIAWTPADITTEAWYDAADVGTITKDGSNRVSQWNDKSGKNRHASQTSDAAKPLSGTRTMNGANALAFSGTATQWLRSTANISSQPLTAFAVTQFDSTGNDLTVFDGAGSARCLLRRRSTNILSAFAGTWVDGNATSAEAAFASVVFNGASSSIRKNGGTAAIGNAGAGDLASGLTIGNINSPAASWRMNGLISELLFLSGAISDADRQQIEGYLAHKWGLAGNLPAGHPFQSAAPTKPAAVATLNGIVSDLENDNLTHQWSLISGPAPVTFANASAASTTATFTAEGIYILRLTSSDAFASSFSEIQIRVGAQSFYHITYYADGATSGTAPVDAGSPYEAAATVTVLDQGDLVKTGHTFSGWNTSPNGTGTHFEPDESFTANGSIQLHAQWMPNAYTVSFDANGGDPPDPASKQVIYSTAYGTLPQAARTGFSFIGWFTAPTGGDPVTDNTSVAIAGDHTLYARWNANPVVHAGPDQSVGFTGTTPWTPAQLPSTAAWYDAADSTKLTIQNGNTVSEWSDKSGNNNHATQGNTTLSPTTGTATIGGKPTVSFRIGDGSNKQFLSAPNHSTLNLDASGGANVFAVFRHLGFANNGSTSVNAPLSKGQMLSAESAYGIRLNSDQSLGFKAGTDIITTASSTADLAMLFSGTRNDTSNTSLLHLNGNLAKTSTKQTAILSDNTSALFLGRDSSTARHANVDFGEIVILGGVLTEEERQKVEGYLAHKWGMAASLPDGHDYKDEAPANPPSFATASLDGTASDAENDPIPASWSMVSGPGGVTFANATSATTTATFSSQGTYVLRLTANDGFSTNFDEITINVGVPDYSVTYDGNGSIGTAPVDSASYYTGATVTILGAGDLVKTGHIFSGWNTEAEGGGTSYAPGSVLVITADTTLYAQWTPKTTPTVNQLPTAAAITEGQPLSAATLSGGDASVPGSFSYLDPSTVPPAGEYAAAVIFTPEDLAIYNPVQSTVNVTVQTAFQAWAGGNVTFTGDSNSDGVADGLAWLLGAGDPAQNANALLPTVIVDNGSLVTTFKMLNQAKRGGAVLKLQYGTTLGSWSTVAIPEESGTHDGVGFFITPNGELNTVVVTTPASAAPDGRFFIRLAGAE